MAVTGMGLLGSLTASSAGTTLAIANTSGVTIPAGTLIHINGTWDNTTLTTAPTVTCSTVGGGTATQNHATAIGSGVTTTAGSGVWHTCFRAVTTTAIAPLGTIATLTSNQSAVKRAGHAAGFWGASTTLRGTVTTAVSTAGTPSVTTTGTALEVGDLVIGSVSYENNAAMTADADTAGGSWSPIVGTFTTGGSANTNVGTNSQSKIVTATAAQTFNPTNGGADCIACVYSLQPAAPPPAIATLADPFDSIADTPPWDLSPAGVSVVNGQLKIAPPNQSTTYRFLNRTDYFSLRGSAVYVEVAERGSQSMASFEAIPLILNNAQLTVHIQFLISSNMLQVHLTAGGNVFAVAYDPGAMRWLQIRESGGTTYFETSSTGRAGTWTTQHSRATTSLGAGFDPDWVVFGASAGTYQSEVGSTAALVIDNLNTQGVQGGPAFGAVSFVGSAVGWSPVIVIDQDAYRFYGGANGEPGVLIDGYPETNADANLTIYNTLPAVGQSFLGTGQPLTSAGFMLLRGAACVPTGTMTAKLYAHTGTFGATGSTPTGAPLATSTTVLDVTTIPAVTNQFLWWFFDFDGTFTPANGTPYYIVLEATGAQPSGANAISLRADGSTATHAGRRATFNGTTWTATATEDYIFQVASGASALAAQDTGPTVDVAAGDVNLQLRLRLQSTSIQDISLSDDFQLQWERNASGTWTDVYGALVLADSYPVNPNYFSTVALSATQPAGGQSFVGNGQKLARVGFYLNRSATAPDGTVTAVLYASTTPGAVGTGLPTGTALATSTTVKNGATDLTTVTGWQYFDFDPTFTLVEGTSYFIAVVTTTTVNNIGLGHDSQTPFTHPGREALMASAGTWSLGSGADVIFEVHTQPATAATTVVPYAAPNLVEGQQTGNRLTGGSGAFRSGKSSRTGKVADLGWTATNFTEVLYAITLKQADLTNGDTLRFRVVREESATGQVKTLTWTKYPSLAIEVAVGAPKTGTSTGGITWAGAAAGKKTPKATVAGAVSWVGAATGTTPVVTMDGSATGAIVWAGAAAGTRAPKASATGAFTFVGTAAGKKTPKATVTGAVNLVGAAAGKYTPKATSTTGAIAWLGSGVGRRVPKATAPGAISWVGAVAGSKMPKASATGAFSCVGTASGKKTPKAVVTGTVTFAGTASGTAPAVVVKTGSAAGAVNWVGSAAGKRTPKATVTGTVSWVGASVGKRVPKASSSGAVALVGSGVGQRAPKAVVTATITWAGLATGERAKAGSVSATITWAGFVTGARVSRGVSTGGIDWVGSAQAERGHAGVVTGLITWTAVVAGKTPLIPGAVSLLIPTTYLVDGFKSTTNLNNDNVRRHVLDLPVIRTWDGDSWNPPPSQVVPTGFIKRFTPGLITKVVDNFNRVASDLRNTTPDVGPNWTSVIAGSWQIDGTHAVAVVSTGVPGIVVGTGDHVATATGIVLDTVPSGSGPKGFRLLIKRELTGSTPGIYAYVSVAQTTGAITWGIRVVDLAGVERDVVSGNPADLALTPGALNTFDMSVSCIGNAVSATVKGVTISGTITEAEVNQASTGNEIGIRILQFSAGLKVDAVTCQVSADPTARTSVVGVTKHIGVNPIKQWRGVEDPHWETLWAPA